MPQVCLERYAENRSRPPPLVDRGHVAELFALWSEFDTDATGWMPSSQLYELLIALPPPLGKPLVGPFVGAQRLRLGDFEHMPVHLSPGGLLYFGDLLTALTAGAYEVDLEDLPDEMLRDVKLTATVSRRMAKRKLTGAAASAAELAAQSTSLLDRLSGAALTAMEALRALSCVHSALPLGGASRVSRKGSASSMGHLVAISDILAACRIQAYVRAVKEKRRERQERLAAAAQPPAQTAAIPAQKRLPYGDEEPVELRILPRPADSSAAADSGEPADPPRRLRDSATAPRASMVRSTSALSEASIDWLMRRLGDGLGAEFLPAADDDVAVQPAPRPEVGSRD